MLLHVNPSDVVSSTKANSQSKSSRKSKILRLFSFLFNLHIEYLITLSKVYFSPANRAVGKYEKYLNYDEGENYNDKWRIEKPESDFANNIIQNDKLVRSSWLNVVRKIIFHLLKDD